VRRYSADAVALDCRRAAVRHRDKVGTLIPSRREASDRLFPHCTITFNARARMTGHLFLAGATTGIENRIVLDDPATAEPKERHQLEGKAPSRCAD
jgi:hypothetical protein